MGTGTKVTHIFLSPPSTSSRPGDKLHFKHMPQQIGDTMFFTRQRTGQLMTSTAELFAQIVELVILVHILMFAFKAGDQLTDSGTCGANGHKLMQ